MHRGGSPLLGDSPHPAMRSSRERKRGCILRAKDFLHWTLSTTTWKDNLAEAIRSYVLDLRLLHRTFLQLIIFCIQEWLENKDWQGAPQTSRKLYASFLLWSLIHNLVCNRYMSFFFFFSSLLEIIWGIYFPKPMHDLDPWCFRLLWCLQPRVVHGLRLGVGCIMRKSGNLGGLSNSPGWCWDIFFAAAVIL